jgi:hypothetical protein
MLPIPLTVDAIKSLDIVFLKELGSAANEDGGSPTIRQVADALEAALSSGAHAEGEPEFALFDPAAFAGHLSGLGFPIAPDAAAAVVARIFPNGRDRRAANQRD